MTEKKSNGQATPSTQHRTTLSLPEPAFAGKIRKTYHKPERALLVLPKPRKRYDDEAAAKIIMALQVATALP